MADPLTIVGSSVASLVTALQAARHGRQVRLYVDLASIGGSFGGVSAGGRRFDLGSRLLELAYEGGGDRPITSFDPEHDGHRPFIAEVARFIREILGDTLCGSDVPEMWIAGHRTTCVLMTVDLSEFPKLLSPADRALVREQVRHIVETQPGHAATAGQTLCEASLSQHGARLHQLLVEPVCGKQYAAWQDVLASDRRKLWAALFTPQTVLEAFSGLPIGFRPHRPFSTTSAGAAFPFVDRLYRAVEACDHVDIIPAGRLTRFSCDPSGLAELGFSNHPALRVHSASCAIGVAPEQAFKAAGVAYAPERVRSAIGWVDVAESEVDAPPAALMVCDPALPLLRVSKAGADPGRSSFAIEYGTHPPDLAAAAISLEQMGVVRQGARIQLVHEVSGAAQVAPTPANRGAFQRALQAFATFRGVLLGGARRFGFDGLNDQIADGLYWGATRC